MLRKLFPFNVSRLSRSPLAAVLVGCLYFLLFLPEDSPRAIDEFDRDEGFGLMKSFLVNRGFSLYGDIWSDQPPAYTYLIAGITRLFGETPETARLLTIFLSSALLGSVYEIARREESSFFGHIGGLSAALSMVMSLQFVRYSVPVMLTLPSISFVVFAWLLLTKPLPSRARAASAGLLFGLGLGVKLIILPVLPAFLLLLGPGSQRISKLRLRIPWPSGSAFGLGCLGAIAVIFGPFLGMPGISDLYAAHADAAKVMEYSSVWNFYREDALLFSLAALGALVTARRSPSARFAIAWMALGTVALARHAPVWDHHRFLISVPAAALVGMGVSRLTHACRRATSFRLATRVATACALGAIGFGVFQGRLSPLIATQEPRSMTSAMRAGLEAARKHAPHARLAITSNQIFAYRLGLPVPPHLAVTSNKRRQTGGLSDEMIRHTVRTAQPDVVILTNRWGKQLTVPMVKDDLGRAYKRVYYEKSARELAVYTRKLQSGS